VFGLDLKRLGHRELRCPHISGPIANPLLILFCIITAHRDSLVVHFDLFAELQVIVDDHLAARSDQSSAHLYRGQPIDVQVREEVILEKDGKEATLVGLPSIWLIPDADTAVGFAGNT
jgi:hypothetical protein